MLQVMWLKKHKVIYSILLPVFLVILFSISLIYKIAPHNYSQSPYKLADFMVSIDGNDETLVTLPRTLSQLQPRTEVMLTTSFFANPGDSLFLKSVFAPIRLYINDQLILNVGQKGDFPSYMNDPPTTLAIVPLPDYIGHLNLRIEYQSPTQRTELSLPALLVGSESAILSNQVKVDGFSFVFSLILILIGAMMALAGLTVLRGSVPDSPFLWLGLFSLSAGIWVFGECDLSAILLPYPTLLYNMAYLGLFCLTIPLLRFGLIILNPRNKLIIKGFLHVLYVAVTLAIVLQLFGVVDFISSLYWFHILVPLGFSLLAAILIWELYRHRNPAAKRFAIAIIILAASTLLELMNYYFHFTTTLTLFFQLGVLIFVIALGVISGYYVQENVFEKSELEYKVAASMHQLELQRLQYQKITENAGMAQRQTHDLRHHLAVISRLNKVGDTEKLEQYLKTLSQNVPADEGLHLAENYAVNAVAAFYEVAAQSENIKTDLKFVIPRELPNTIESDLCIIIGNLLENAVEASATVPEEKRYLCLGSNLEHQTLTIVVENSFSGKIRTEKGRFLSSKHPGEGVGLASVVAVAEKYGGRTRFEAQDGVFKASVYLHLPEC